MAFGRRRKPQTMHTLDLFSAKCAECGQPIVLLLQDTWVHRTGFGGVSAITPAKHQAKPENAAVLS